MSFSDKITASIATLTPYQVGMTSAQAMRFHGLEQIHKLSSNEAPIAPSPKVCQAMASATIESHLYPDYYDFKSLLAEYYGLAQNQVVLGNGSIDVIETAFRLFSDGKSNIVCSRYGYSAYPLLAKACNLDCKVAPSADSLGHDIKALADAFDENTAIVIIDNPTNLAGQTLSIEQVKALMESVPDSVMVIIDEAYIEFIPNPKIQSAVNLVNHYNNLLVTRTFSKAYGIAGLRVGFGLANEKIIELITRIQCPCAITNVAMAAAKAALADTEHYRRIQQVVADGKAILYQTFDKLGVKYLPSDGNFVVFKSPLFIGGEEVVEDKKDIKGRNLAALLLQQGYIVRPMKAFGRDDLIRVSIMEQEVMKGLAQQIERLI